MRGGPSAADLEREPGPDFARSVTWVTFHHVELLTNPQVQGVFFTLDMEVSPVIGHPEGTSR